VIWPVATRTSPASQRGPANGAWGAHGDRVRWNDRYTGTVRAVVDDMAEVEETAILGRRAVWRLRLDALTRLP
jgi:hypothetical protein